MFAAQSRQARAELEVANPDGRLRPGMFVRVRIVLATRDDAVTVPRDALVERDGGAAVYVVDGEVARLVPVTLGLDDGERVEVTGVTPPSRVVTLGQTLLEDGAAITVPAPAEGERAP